MKRAVLPIRIFRFYVDGFKSMKLGRTLWTLILIKLFVIFIILRMVFFPRFLNQFETTSEKENYVSDELIHRAIAP